MWTLCSRAIRITSKLIVLPLVTVIMWRQVAFVGSSVFFVFVGLFYVLLGFLGLFLLCVCFVVVVVVCLFVLTLQTHVMVILSTLQECLQFVLNFDFNFKIFHLSNSLSVYLSFCLFVCLFKRPPAPLSVTIYLSSI